MEATPSADRELRPLGIGEVLDRAVTLCVRFFVPLAVVYVVFAVPQGVIQYFAGRSFARLFLILTQTLRTQGTRGTPADPTLLAHQLAALPAPSGWTLGAWVLVILLAPLALGALVSMTAQDYLGRASSFAQAYRTALDRWLPLIGVIAIFIVAGIFLYVAFAFVLTLVGFGIAFLYVFSHPLGLAIGIPLAIAVVLATLAFVLVAVLALQVAYFTCVIERASPIGAFVSSLARVFGGIGFPRALLFGGAYLAIAIGVGVVALVGELATMSFLHSEVAAQAYATLLRLVAAIFTTAFACIFYFDLRVREEGFDLQLAAQEVLL
jgi:hypothetical protein